MRIGRTVLISDIKEVKNLLKLSSNLYNKHRIKVDSLILMYYANQNDLYNEIIEIGDLNKLTTNEYYCRAKVCVLQYPDNLAYYEGSNISNFESRVLQQYKENEETALNDKQKLIIWRCAVKNKDRDILSKFLPYVLFISKDINSGLKLISDAQYSHVEMVRPIIEAVLLSRFKQLYRWNCPDLDNCGNSLKRHLELFKTVSYLNTDSGVEDFNRNVAINLERNQRKSF